MMIKWIRCHVVDVDAFDRGQQAWSELSSLPGFLGQGGGWSRHESGIAHVFTWWNDQQVYQAFMTDTHDHLAANQAGIYDTIKIRLLEHHLDIGAGFPLNFADGALLRLAHCQVRAGRQEHFIRAQTDVWNPGMHSAPGMRGGVFTRRGNTEFVVLSLWTSVADHERYNTDRFPNLQRRALPADDLDTLTSDLIDLNPTWTITTRR